MRKFTFILSLLVAFVATAMAQTTYYKPGERKSSFNVGDKVFIYCTTLVPSYGQDRTGFLMDNGSSVDLNKAKPSNLYVTDGDARIWNITACEEMTDDSGNAYHVLNITNGSNSYLGTNGTTDNTEAVNLYVQSFSLTYGGHNLGDDCSSENADETTSTVASSITADNKVWTVRANIGSGDFWNANTNSFATWSSGYPYAFYSVDVADVTPVSLNHIYNGTTFKTETLYAATGSNTADVAAEALSIFGLTAGTPSYSAETVAEGTTISITYTLNSELPFEISNIDGTFGDDVKWYYMDIQRDPTKNVTYDITTDKVLTGNVTTKAARNLFAFAGDPANGFEIYNYVAGANKVFWRADATNGGRVFFTEKSATNGNRWMLTANGTSGYVFRLNGFETGYLNDHQPDMAIWNSSWGATDGGSTIQFTEVTDIATLIENEKPLLAQDITTVVDAAKAKIGTGFGKYSADEEFDGIVTELESFVEGVSSTTTIEELIEKYNTATTLTSHLIMNVPTNGKFYRLKGNTSGKYIKTTAASGKNPMTSDQEIYETTIYLDENGKLMSFATGLYLLIAQNSSGTWNFSHASSSVGAAVFEAGSAEGTFRIAISGRQLYDNGNDNGGTIDAAGAGATGERYDWIVEEMSYLPVKTNSSSINVATFYSPVAISTNTWSQRVKAYTGEIKDGYVTLTQITTESNIKNEWGDDITAIVIPANTPVYLERVTSDTELTSDGCTNLQIVYDFEGTLEEGVVNDFRGTIESKNVEESDIYVLGIGNDAANPVIGLYKAAENYSNGFKAYLPAPETGAQGIAAYGVRYAEGTTAIDEVEAAEAGEQVIYDLTGRRVESISAPGIYIVNGNKVVIK